MTRTTMNTLALLQALDPIEPEKAHDRSDDAQRALSVPRSLRSVAQLYSTDAYALCRKVAQRALGRLPGPHMEGLTP